MVEALLEKETLTREEIDLICEGKSIADLLQNENQEAKEEEKEPNTDENVETATEENEEK